MKTVYLVRHTEYSNPDNILVGRLPVELSQHGLQQAEQLGEYFADKAIEKMYASAVRRCQQTANIISSNSIPIEYDLRLLETFSAYQGYRDKNLAHSNDPWRQFFSHRHELGGEDYAAIQDRVIDFWQELIKKDFKNVVICSHGDPLYLLWHWLKQKPLPDESESAGDRGEYPTKGAVRPILIHDDGNVEVQNQIAIATEKV